MEAIIRGVLGGVIVIGTILAILFRWRGRRHRSQRVVQHELDVDRASAGIPITGRDKKHRSESEESFLKAKLDSPWHEMLEPQYLASSRAASRKQSFTSHTGSEITSPPCLPQKAAKYTSATAVEGEDVWVGERPDPPMIHGLSARVSHEIRRVLN